MLAISGSDLGQIYPNIWTPPYEFFVMLMMIPGPQIRKMDLNAYMFFFFQVMMVILVINVLKYFFYLSLHMHSKDVGPILLLDARQYSNTSVYFTPTSILVFNPFGSSPEINCITYLIH